MRFFSRSKVRIFLLVSTALIALAFVVGGVFPAFAAGAFLDQFKTITKISTTVPSNGDLNPYGLVVVPRTIGNLVAGDILISNFNNSQNLSGTGSTIVEISPGGQLTLFAQIDPNNLHGACPGGVGLTTALVVLKRGWVIVGSLPTADGTPATAKAGCLIVLDSHGNVVETFADGGINGPWDMTALDLGAFADLFVTNVLNGPFPGVDQVVNKGTVLRINLLVPEQGEGKPRRLLTTVIGSGFSEETDPAATVIGPTGVGLGHDGTLYVADAVKSRIAAIPHAVVRFFSAGTGKTVTEGGAVNGPLGMAIAPNGDILTVNGGDGNIVETTPGGNQVAVKTLDNTPMTPPTPAGAGTLFGVAVAPGGAGIYFDDDGTATLNLFN